MISGIPGPHNRSHLKNWILVQDQGGSEFQPAGILRYVEDVKRGSNAEIGPKDFIEIASILPEIQSFAQGDISMVDRAGTYRATPARGNGAPRRAGRGKRGEK
jgi:hypothetical protein